MEDGILGLAIYLSVIRTRDGADRRCSARGPVRRRECNRDGQFLISCKCRTRHVVPRLETWYSRSLVALYLQSEATSPIEDNHKQKGI